MILKRVFCILLFFGVFVGKAEAVSLYLDPGTATLFRGDALTAAVRIMPEEANSECINAVDVVVTYPESIQPVDVSIGRSILSVWVESPVINKELRTITFAGGIPNGYCGRVEGDPSLTNVLADIVFRSPGLQIGGTAGGDEAMIEFAPESKVYLNDGQGTEAALRTVPARITLEKTAGSGIVDEWREEVRDDNIPPESFSIQLEKDPTGQYYIIAQTTDKQTGISHYEVIEEPIAEIATFNWGRTDAPWVRMENNYHHRLTDQTLNSIIRVRAYDKAGNEYVATYVPDESIRTLSKNALYTYILMAALGVLGIVILLVAVVYIRRRLKRRAQRNENIDDEAEVLEEDIV